MSLNYSFADDLENSPEDLPELRDFMNRKIVCYPEIFDSFFANKNIDRLRNLARSYVSILQNIFHRIYLYDNNVFGDAVIVRLRNDDDRTIAHNVTINYPDGKSKNFHFRGLWFTLGKKMDLTYGFKLGAWTLECDNVLFNQPDIFISNSRDRNVFRLKPGDIICKERYLQDEFDKFLSFGY